MGQASVLQQQPASESDEVIKILLVDDIVDNLLALEALLKQTGIQVFSATSATQALELLLENDFAVAVIDVQMPDINGFELANIMHSTERTRHIPIVFVTAGSIQKSYSLQGYECGAIDFLYKPLDNDVVRSKIKIFVELYRQRRELSRQIAALLQSQREQQTLLEELQQIRDELQQSMRLRDDFMSVVSHELRTPLNTLKLELYTRRLHIENGDAGAFSLARMEDMVANDERQLNQLVRLINDMTDVSRIRTGQLSMRPTEVDLVQLAQRVVAQFSNQLGVAATRATVHAVGELAPGELTVRADEFRIEQAVINLLTNAIRHCAAKPIDIFVERHVDTATGAWILLGVRDYGKGISPADQTRIFEQFERGENERKGSGLGLGLFIANQIVAAHGGTLRVESQVEQGALFTLALPVSASTSAV